MNRVLVFSCLINENKNNNHHYEVFMSSANENLYFNQILNLVY